MIREHDYLICGLDWESTCDWCRTLWPEDMKPKAAPRSTEPGLVAALVPQVWVQVDFDEILGESKLAFHVLLSSGQILWIPFSQIENEGRDYRVGYINGTMGLTPWIVRQKGLQEGSQEPERPPEDYQQEYPDFDQYEGYDND